ncbi:MAG: permease-like cell division protein FtsX [bacterium]
MQTIFSTTLKHLRRSPYSSLAAILMTIVTFFIVSVFTFTILGAHSVLTFFESRPQVTAFLKDDATLADVDALKSSLASQVELESSTYISKDQALAIYQSQNQDNPLLLEMVTADILPASLEVSAKSVADLESIASTMKADSHVEEVVYQKDVVDTLKSWVNGLRLAGLSLSSLLLFASLITIVIILGLKFTTRKVEINTLSLLGATSWYIRGPFVIEGIFYALIGAILGWGIAYLLLLYLTPNLVSFLQNIPLLPVSFWFMLTVLGVQLLVAIILGSLASLIATRRYGQ